MATYCFRCLICGELTEGSVPVAPSHCDTTMARDYRSEGVAVGAGVRVSRDGTVADQAKLFLPDNRDFAGPGDADGTKGMADWHERFEPKTGQGANTPGRHERTTF